MVDVVISETAEKELNSLDSDVKDRIVSKMLDEVASDPKRYIKPLQNSPHGSVRAGDYRVIVEWDRDADHLRIHDVGHRRNIYDDR
jgi:mRNA interferase RelE/StbE